MSHVSFAYIPQCHMSNLRKYYVPCHYLFSQHVACHYALCRIISNLSNAHVVLSILGAIEGPYYPTQCPPPPIKAPNSAMRFGDTGSKCGGDNPKQPQTETINHSTLLRSLHALSGQRGSSWKHDGQVSGSET